MSEAEGRLSREQLGDAAVFTHVRELIERGEGVEVRTARGSWRWVVAVYGDKTFGTVGAGGKSIRGRFTIVEADEVTAVRPGQLS
jgi:hypothetical protein